MFDEAIRARGRSDVVTKPQFLQVQESAQAGVRRWRVSDLDVLNDLHKAAENFSGTGASFRDFIDSAGPDDAGPRLGRDWRPMARRLVLAERGHGITAGRYKQAQDAGVGHWYFTWPAKRQLPRGGLRYPLGDGPMPPLDFGCRYGWEPVFDELPAADERIPTQTLKSIRIQEFQFRPASFAQARAEGGCEQKPPPPELQGGSCGGGRRADRNLELVE